MEAEYLEIRSPGASGPPFVPLVGTEVTLGRSEANEVALPEDQSVSWVHAAIRRMGMFWCIRDLGSTNGTYVNGKRISSEVALKPSDEIRVGGTILRFMAPTPRPGGPTLGAAKPPRLTDRERDVLKALCRPVVSASTFTEPASVRTIAKELFVTEATVKQHLLRLYDKFHITEPDQRRTRLANEALRLGVVTRADLAE